MFELKMRDALVMVGAGLLLAWQGLILSGCDQVRPAQPSAKPVASAVQPSPWVDPACYVEGHLVALECNELGTYPACPAEDSPYQAGEPCFWINPNGKGLLWSDGIPSDSEK